MAKEFRSRRWRKLLNLIDHLPRTSHYFHAVSQSEEVAEYRLRMGGKSAEPAVKHTPPFTEYSPEVEHLSNIEDLLGALIYQNSGSKDGHMYTAKRPDTATDKVQERQRRETYVNMVSRMVPADGDEREPV